MPETSQWGRQIVYEAKLELKLIQWILKPLWTGIHSVFAQLLTRHSTNFQDSGNADSLWGPYPAVPVAGIEISRINMWCLVFSDAEIAMKSGIVHMVKAQAD